ncbi:ParB N-terminal domain-containing protein [Streptomyces sp. RB6PN25]|uniref:ParB N-terminal domain-containing protein n=1 Tax=Streptomyces humicola TaxID=2953240 RepID=A0ABT1PQ10_9ACTN|nr:ParB N-terminal domain-containing protein [Streptomyces humicola]MCQ4079759.1 ParB N-terminal domain-containing protein [Streptomyces humicola]
MSLEHAQKIAVSGLAWPPIIVHQPSLRVIDGMHRLRAAVMLGQSHIEARLFEGTDEDAFVLAVEANTGQGRVLSLAERRSAAVRILVSHPQWSDRAVAFVTGLSAKTVGSLRRREADHIPQPPLRVGRDGRIRSLDTSQKRRSVGRLLTDRPGASLREIARIAGVSPGTVRDVRDRLHRGEDPVPARRGSTGKSGAARPTRAAAPTTADITRTTVFRKQQEDLAAIFHCLCRDPSLRLTDTGRLLLRMLEVHTFVLPHWKRVTESVPAHCADAVSAAAAECAEAWQNLAAEMVSRKCA